MSARRTVVLATRNPGKLREIAQVLGAFPLRWVGLGDLPSGEIPEPAEDGRTFAENARAKALYYARATGLWALADDSGLAVDALGGEPGVRSARYAADACPDGADRATIDLANNERVLQRLRDVPEERRTARFLCHLALADAEKVLLEAIGTVEGRIARRPSGENGFGYDPLFFVPELGCTTAELSPEEKNRVSHRGQAVRRFAQKLAELLGGERT